MRLALAMLICIIGFGCGKPSPPLSDEEMIDLMVDVHLAEALINTYHPVKLRDSFNTVYMDLVLRDHQLTEEQFEVIMDHVLSDPDYLEYIYQEVVEEINERQSALDMTNSQQGGRQNLDEKGFK